MRHGNAGRKFDRDGSSRAAMFKNLVANLFAHERIETTVPKAKELRRIAERFIARAASLGADANAQSPSTPDAAARRLALKRQFASELPRWRERIVDGKIEKIDVIEHLFREIAPRFVSRPGGYTRILKTRNRKGDNAELAFIELVQRDPRVGKKVVVAADTSASLPETVRAEAPKARKADEGGDASTEG
ncbi:MAG: 50S ribosomal protein L17 [Myxococcales bacterium]|nr:50S ribosomal protein L17 [Myxococcales bacterium]